VEVSALKHAGPVGIHGRSPLLRLQSDERLVTLTRRGNHGAYEALVGRYESRLLAFCRHMVNSREDAEDVLQEVFAASFTAMTADDRPINVRPWLYRIARNRSLNHLRRRQAIGVDSMDTHFADQGASTADKVHKREEFRQLIGDVGDLAETQRTALLLREIDALSYEQIAEAMDTTVPSVKSLLVRARVSLAEAAEARLLTCDEVRLELGEVAEGIAKISPPVRRHLKTCERCSSFRKQLKDTNKALAAMYPVGPLLLLKKGLLAKLGTTASAGGAGAVGAGGAGGAAGAAAGASAGSAISAGFGAVATKAAATIAAAALVTAAGAEVRHTVVRQAPVQTVASVTHAAVPHAPAHHKTVAKPHAKSALAALKKDAKATGLTDKAGAAKLTTGSTGSTGSTGTTGVTPAPSAPAVSVSVPAITPSGTQTSGDTTVLTSGTQTDGDTTILPATQPSTTGASGPSDTPTGSGGTTQPTGSGGTTQPQPQPAPPKPTPIPPVSVPVPVPVSGPSGP
jgi:RNA polymerase sigma factor (sigma-70 family)